MKIHLKLVPLVFLALMVGLLAGCSPAINLDSEGLIVGQSYRLRSGETLNQDLTVMGGSAELEKGSTVNGNVAVLGGSLSINGEVTGDVSAMGGVVSLGDTAIIDGDVFSLGATVSKSENAIVKGSIGAGRPNVRVPGTASRTIESGARVFWNLVSPIFQSFALAALAVLVSLFALRPMERISDTMMAQPVVAGGIGLLSVIVLPVLMVILSITIILLPVGLLGILSLAIALLFGWIAAGLLTGERLAQALKQNWTGPVSAGIGTLVLSLAAALFAGIIPCIGWLVPFLLASAALGSVVLTRFGLVVYPQPTSEFVPPSELSEMPSAPADANTP